jgi:hypothetical protein
VVIDTDSGRLLQCCSACEVIAKWRGSKNERANGSEGVQDTVAVSKPDRDEALAAPAEESSKEPHCVCCGALYKPRWSAGPRRVGDLGCRNSKCREHIAGLVNARRVSEYIASHQSHA